MARTSRNAQGRWSGAQAHHPWDARTRCSDAPLRHRLYASAVTHRPLARRRPAPAHHLLGAVLGALVVVGCGGAGPSPSFDVAAGCPSEGRAAGAYPDLEARIPKAYEGRGPISLDSGRHCDPTSLGSLAAAGFDEVRFAGGTWDLGAYRAAALVVFEAPGLTAQQVAEFYDASAQGANRTQITAGSTPAIAGRQGYRLDTETGDRLQTVVTWPSEDENVVNVVITNDLPDPKIQAAVDAFGGG
jgi:hypothetical protein